jgi:1-acyl-sn-glycerol-3-phosphate acyltransferase
MQRHAAPAPNPTRRAFPWLPDAGLDPHPLGSWLLELGFDLWIDAFYRRSVILPEAFHTAPGTMIASNHQRDVDGPMLGTVLVRRRGLRFEWPLPFFATREDLFRPGILSRLTVHWPKPLPALLGRISLAWFFPLGRAEPMRRMREFTLGEALQALCNAGLGQTDCAELLNARGLRELAVRHAALADGLARAPPATLDGWWGLRRLQPGARRAIATRLRATVATQLDHFAQRLDQGRCVYFAPEGTISMDGHFCRVRAGFFRLVHMAAAPPWIQPMALAYDTLAPGRSRVVIRIGERFRADTTLDRRAFDAGLRHAILGLAPVTPSHLLAHWLLHGPTAFTRAELVDWCVHAHAALHSVHPCLDPLFAHAGVARIVNTRLRWLERRELLIREGDRFRNACSRDAPPGWHTPANVVRYLDNNLEDLVPDVARVLPC